MIKMKHTTDELLIAASADAARRLPEKCVFALWASLDRDSKRRIPQLLFGRLAIGLQRAGNFPIRRIPFDRP